MAVSAPERRSLLSELARLAVVDLAALWRRASALDVEFPVYLAAAYPEVTEPYVAAAAMLSATWFEESDPESSYVAEVSPPLPRARLNSTVQWALGADGEKALDRLSGSTQRAVFDGARETTMLNVDLEPGTRWAREARPNACAFCRMMSTRGAVYRTERDALRVSGRSVDLSISDRRMRASGLASTDELLARRMGQTTYVRGKRKGQAKTRSQRGKQALGEKYHDDCYCIAVEVRSGYYEPPEYAMEWENEYEKAVQLSDSGDPKKILAEWRALDGVSR
ncbi:hypothetical protein [Mycolicibacterium austroafricanum]|uniref:VG15 protein n=1 Tax=Mycolicibacterium austroafricanum TaxID=39687 RepID=UPI001CA34572|nr:hypothetical protein [Mycolicibacterium austroafricanum]QZT61251.1 hypothetical protein JN085_19990 [Mycolicibacterium austroafricanum]